MSGRIPLCLQKLLDLAGCFCRVITLAKFKCNAMEPICVNDCEIAYSRLGIEALTVWGMSQLYAKTKFIEGSSHKISSRPPLKKCK